MSRTKGSIENEIADAAVKFQREQQGRGAGAVRAHLIGDLVIVRSSSIFTPTEARLAVSEEGCRLIKSSRYELRSINHAEIEEIVAGIVGCAVRHSFFDVNVQAAEQMETYVLEYDVERKLLRSDLGRMGGLSPKVK